MNRILAALLLIISIPFFFVISIIIGFEDGFPIFFKQQRVGKDNNLFFIYKFRTMKKNTPNVATNLLVNPDLYILRSGHYLRKLSLDELPNLFNILKGEMVFVGPRPALYNQHDLISMRNKIGIQKLKPGITGWAQINGRDDLTLNEKVDLDREYFSNKSFLLDIRILLLTFISVIKKDGISH